MQQSNQIPYCEKAIKCGAAIQNADGTLIRSVVHVKFPNFAAKRIVDMIEVNEMFVKEKASRWPPAGFAFFCKKPTDLTAIIAAEALLRPFG